MFGSGRRHAPAPVFGDRSAPAAAAHTQTVPDFFTGEHKPCSRHVMPTRVAKIISALELISNHREQRHRNQTDSDVLAC